MTKCRIFAAATVVTSILALAACNKAPSDGSPSSDANNSLASSSAPVAATEDATAAAVGAVSAATTLTASGFVTAAATSDMYEIGAAKLAAQKATSPAVKKFAARMMRDHTASTKKLTGLVTGGGVTASLPADLDARRKGLENNLEAATDADFDKTYVDQQVAAHDEAVTLFKGYADKGDNAALKAFATATLPTIRAHLAMIKDIQASLGK